MVSDGPLFEVLDRLSGVYLSLVAMVEFLGVKVFEFVRLRCVRGGNR